MTTYVFLDESGDLSFDFQKSGVSQHFIITALITQQPRQIEKAVKSTIRWCKVRYKKHCGCLHAYHEDQQTRLRLLRSIANLDCVVAIIRLNKHKVYTKLQDEKAVLYNYVTNILIDRLMSGGFLTENVHVHLLVSKRETNRFLNLNFQTYLRKQVQEHHSMQLDISILSPNEHKGLQAADMLSWSVFRRLEHNDTLYYDVVQHLISESPLFP